MTSSGDDRDATSRALRAYRLLVRCYPASYRERFEEELLETFAASQTDPAVAGTERVRFYVREVWGLLVTAARERWASLTTVGGPPSGRGWQPHPRRTAALVHGVSAALRTLRRNPGFTAGASALFGVGAGVATLMFSVVDAVVLEPLDVPEADRVVQLRTVGSDGTRSSILPVGLLRALVDENDVFEEVAGYQPWADILATETEVRTLNSLGVTPNFLRLVGADVITGRGLEPADYEPDAPRVAMLGHAFWLRRYGGDPGVVGRTLPLSTSGRAERPATIVGVLSADFRLPPMEQDYPGSFATAETPEVVHPVPERWMSGQQGMATGMLARLKEGVTLEQARANLEGLVPGLAAIAPAWMDLRGFQLSPLPDLLRRHYGPALYIFWAASGLLLLIACANVANLLTARGLMRRREMAVRSSLGADRGRLFAQLLAESGLLGLFGGLFGAAVAYVGIQVMVSVFPGDVYRLASAGLDGRALGFLVAASLVPPLAFGALPAWQGSGFGRSTLLTSSYPGSRAPRAGVLRGLVVAQVALALVVVTGGSLLVRTYRNLTAVDLGYDAERVLTFSLSTFPGSYTKYARDAGRLTSLVRDRLAGVPGVVSAANGWIPLTWDAGSPRWRLSQRPDGPGEEIQASGWDVGPGFFETLGIEVVAGRTLSREEWERALMTRNAARTLDDDPEGRERMLAGAPAPVVINETMAVRYWGDAGRAVGSTVWSTMGRDPGPHEVIGVVRDIRRPHDTEPGPQTFVASGWRSFLVRTAVDPLAVAPDIRRAVEQLDPVELSIPSFTTMAELVAAEADEERFRMQVLVLAAGLALALAAVGLFGVMAYSVSRRTHEIAVRMSLGARTAEVMRLVAGQSLRIILVGIGIGLLGAVALARSMESLLFGVAPLDAASFTASALLLTAVSALACYLPTLRAATVDPAEVLRDD